MTERFGSMEMSNVTLTSSIIMVATQRPISTALVTPGGANMKAINLKWRTIGWLICCVNTNGTE